MANAHIRVLQWPDAAIVYDSRVSTVSPVSTVSDAPNKPAPRLANLDPDARGIPYPQWKAARLKELFLLHSPKKKL
jgi:hypothetical protein